MRLDLCFNNSVLVHKEIIVMTAFEKLRKNGIIISEEDIGLISILFACLTYFFKHIPPADSNACLLIIFYSFFTSININIGSLYIFFCHASNRI